MIRIEIWSFLIFLCDVKSLRLKESRFGVFYGTLDLQVSFGQECCQDLQMRLRPAWPALLDEISGVFFVEGKLGP